MPPFSILKKKYTLEPEDLPNPNGPSVVVIEAFDSETYTDNEGVQQVRHELWFAGYRYPFRLNNTRVDILVMLFGQNTEDAVGKKLILMPGVTTAYGKSKPCINIHPTPCPAETPATPVPQSLAIAPMGHRAEVARAYQVAFAPAAPTALRIGGTAAPAAQPPQSTTIQAPLGMESAAKIIAGLEIINKTWDDAVSHLRTLGMGELVTGKAPPDVSNQVLDLLRRYCGSFPKVKSVDVPARVAELIASWMPPKPTTPPSAESGIKFDPKTGEVIDDRPGAPPVNDDIPF